jgi:hypothetical protein
MRRVIMTGAKYESAPLMSALKEVWQPQDLYQNQNTAPKALAKSTQSPCQKHPKPLPKAPKALAKSTQSPCQKSAPSLPRITASRSERCTEISNLASHLVANTWIASSALSRTKTSNLTRAMMILPNPHPQNPYQGFLPHYDVESCMIDSTLVPGVCKTAAVAALCSSRPLKPFVFRNYQLPPGVKSIFPGSSCSLVKPLNPQPPTPNPQP